MSGAGWAFTPALSLALGKVELAETFTDYQLAINVLKHGQGRRSSQLEFKIKPEGELYFFEGAVSEVSVSIDVDEQFVRRCAALIREASSVIASISLAQPPR